MEGDTASFLYLLPNGLGVSDHPEFGSWGGRYVRVSPSDGLYADATDTVAGIDGKLYRNSKATIWRWREAYQNDFAARIAWTVSASRTTANNPPEPVINGRSGLAPIEVTVVAGESLVLDATGTRDPDGDALRYHWFEYTDLNPGYTGIAPLSLQDNTATQVRVTATRSKVRSQHHIILEVQDAGTPPITRYRRAIVNVEPAP